LIIDHINALAAKKFLSEQDDIMTSAQKQPSCKKRCSPVKMASVKNTVKSKGQPRNGCDGIG